MSGIPVPATGDINQAPTINAIAWTEAAIAITVVSLRLLTRWQTRTLGADDWWMLAALVVFLGVASELTYSGTVGVFREIYYVAQLGPAAIIAAQKANYAGQALRTMSFTPAKTAVALLVLRIIGSNVGSKYRWQRYSIWLMLALVWIVNFLGALFAFIQCDPPASLWDASIMNKTCWNGSIESGFALFQIVLGTLFDMLLAIVPSTLIYGLNMDLKKRISLCVLLGLGVISAVCGIVKLVYVATLPAHFDVTIEAYHVIVWSISELFVLIVCGSIPPIQPLWMQCLGGKGWSSARSKSSGRYGYRQRSDRVAGSAGRKGSQPYTGDDMDLGMEGSQHELNSPDVDKSGMSMGSSTEDSRTYDQQTGGAKVNVTAVV